MGIKGTSQTLYVRKTEAGIITFLGNKKLVLYDDLKQIDYMYAMKRNSGFIKFTDKHSHTIRFKFNVKSNEKILKTLRFIKANYPYLAIREKNVEDLKFFQRWRTTRRTGLILTALSILLLGFYGMYAIYPRYSVIAIDSISSSDHTDKSIGKSENMPLASEKTEAYSTTLTAGHYLIGTDIPVGTYHFYSKKGTGNLLSSDGAINVIFDHNNESGKSIGIDNFGTEELSNIYLSEGVSLTVTGAQEISAGCDDGLVDSMIERDQSGLKEMEVGYGQFGASDNIPAGTYDIEWIEGNGNIICASSIDSGINEIMGESADESSISSSLIKKFKNLIISEGDILKIEEIKVKLIPSK